MSSFQTVGRISRLLSYAEADAKYETTKPIRGSDNLRPLGARRDAARYYIVKGQTAIYAYLYSTPVVTFHSDNTIHIRTDGYDSALSIDFIGQVLGIPACRTRGQCVFTIDGVKYVTSGREGKLVLRSDNGKLSVTEQQTHKQYVISRTGANNVRRRHSEFRDYLKGFLKLRTQTFTFNSPYRYPRGVEERELVHVNVPELVETMGTVKHDDGWSSNPQKNDYIDASTVHQITWINGPSYTSSNKLFHLLIQNGQSEETKLRNFYVACMSLVVAVTATQQTRAIPVEREYVRVAPSDILTMLDEIQFKWFSDEVFVMAEVPEGKVPNHKYDLWVKPII